MSWVLEDPLVHPYIFLRPDLVPLAPFLDCSPEDTVDGSGVLVEPHAIDEQFRTAWMPFFCRGDKENADLDAFWAVAEGLTPLLDEVKLPPLSGDMLYDAVQKKKPTAGSLDGWGWREFKDLPAVWFDRLAFFLTVVEDDGIWLDGLLDSYFALIPKTDGDSTPWGSGLHVYSLLHIGFGPLSGYSIFRSGLSLGFQGRFSVLGLGEARLRPGILLLLEESLSGALDSDVHFFLLQMW